MSGILRKLPREAFRLLGTTLEYRSNPIKSARRYWSLYRWRRFSPDEICFLGLLDPKLSDADLEQFVSKEELLALQQHLNPIHLHPLTEDKMQFYEHCRTQGLPTPRILAVYGDDREYSPDIPCLHNPEDIASLLNSLAVDYIIIKPTGGCHGDGIMRLTRKNGAWYAGDIAVSSAALHQHISESPYSRWIFQEYITGHPDLGTLSATDGLQTIRVISLLGPDNRVEMLAARLRLIAGDGARDNFDYGKTGNIIANIDITNGSIRSAVGARYPGGPICSITVHPRTKRDLTGYRLPHWPEVLQLARDAAIVFGPLRTVGWDIAITPDAPCLIEGNVNWDTLSGEPRMGEIYRHLQRTEPLS